MQVGACEKCNMESLIERWNEATLNDCKTRETKREFRPLIKGKKYKTRRLYKCPICGHYQTVKIEEKGE